MTVAGGAAGSEDEVTGPSGNAASVALPDALAHPLDPWGWWVVRWLAAMLTVSFLAITLLLALDRDGWSVAWIVVWALPIAFLVAVMTLVAAALRWLLARFTPLQDAIVPVVALGAIAGAVPLWLFYFGGDATPFTGPALRDALGVTLPAGLGRAVASYLAERQVSARRPRWWMATSSAGLVGAIGSALALLA